MASEIIAPWEKFGQFHFIESVSPYIFVLTRGRIILKCGKYLENSYFEFGTNRVKNRAKNSLTKNVFTGTKLRLVSSRNTLTSSCLFKTETSLRELQMLIVEQYETPSEFWYYNALPQLIKFLSSKHFLAQCGNVDQWIGILIFIVKFEKSAKHFRKCSACVNIRCETICLKICFWTVLCD